MVMIYDVPLYKLTFIMFTDFSQYSEPILTFCFEYIPDSRCFLCWSLTSDLQEK